MGQTDKVKSIATKKLVFNDTLLTKVGRWTERGFFFLIAITIVIIALSDIWDGYKTDNLPISRIVVAFVFISMASWLIHGLFHLDDLVIITGIEKSKNKDLMYDIVSEMFIDTKFVFVNDQLIGSRRWTMKKTEKAINIIFHGSDVYINIKHKARFGNMDSPFHVLTTQADIKEIKVRFLEKTAANNIFASSGVDA
jgi:hypothetical protein